VRGFVILENMNTYSIRLKNKYEIAERTFAFVFEKPPEFQFQAGQYTAMTLPKLDFTDTKGATRVLSIASAPSDTELMFGMRITESAFKKTLAEMPLGGEVMIRSATGHFVLPEDQEREIVFLAGGIGITPVRSMLRQAAIEKRRNPFVLFYSNRRPEDAPFCKEVQNFSELNYRCIDTLTQNEGVCAWQEESGYICAEMLKKYLTEISHSLYYVVGATVFIGAMEKILAELDIPDANIKKDPFTGL
jgi:ferredoxin-NADP reductase